jgi:hypothetical protein
VRVWCDIFCAIGIAETLPCTTALLLLVLLLLLLLAILLHDCHSCLRCCYVRLGCPDSPGGGSARGQGRLKLSDSPAGMMRESQLVCKVHGQQAKGIQFKRKGQPRDNEPAIQHAA